MRIHRAPMTLIRRLAVSLMTFVAFLSSVSPQASAAFSVPARLSMTTQDSADQQVASSGPYVYVVWRDNPSETVFNPEILLARSSDGGKTFGAAVNLSNRDGNSGSPGVAASGPNVYVIWSEVDGYQMRQSPNSGETFGSTRNLTTLFGIPASGSCAIAASANNVFLSCQQPDPITGQHDIFVSRSNDSGNTFSALENISNTPIVGSTNSRIAASGSDVYVVWQEGFSSLSEIYFNRSTDNGVAFELQPRNISEAAGSSISPTVDADGSTVWIAWSDRAGGGSDEIFFRRTLDEGATFEAVDNLSNNVTGSTSAHVEGKGSQVYLAWADIPAGCTSPCFPEIYLRNSFDGGEIFGDTINISNSPSINSNQPRVALTNLAVSVFWGEPAAFRDVYYSYQELAIPVPPPSLLSLSPASGIQAQSVDVVLTGEDFQEGAVWQLNGTGVTVRNVQFVSSTTMNATMDIALDAEPGARDLTVINPDGQSATLTGAFTVMSASALMLIDITRTDVNTGAGNGEFLSGSSSYESLLAHLENAERALLRQPADLAAAINQMDAFYIKIRNMAKGNQPEITAALYNTLYNDYAAVMSSLGGTVKPAL
jgi:hypothetical protein